MLVLQPSAGVGGYHGRGCQSGAFASHAGALGGMASRATADRRLRLKWDHFSMCRLENCKDTHVMALVQQTGHSVAPLCYVAFHATYYKGAMVPFGEFYA